MHGQQNIKIGRTSLRLSLESKTRKSCGDHVHLTLMYLIEYQHQNLETQYY